MDPYERLAAINESMLKRSVTAVKRGMQRAAFNVGTNRAMYKQGGLFDPPGVENKKNLANTIRSFSPRSSVNFTKAKPAGQNTVGPRTMRNVVLARTTSRIAGKRLGRKLASVADKASVGGKAVSGAVQSAVGAAKRMRAARRKKRAIANEEVTRLKRPHRVQKKKQTRKAKEIFKAIDKAANTQEDPKEVEARLAAFYDKQDRSIFGESNESPVGKIRQVINTLKQRPERPSRSSASDGRLPSGRKPQGVENIKNALKIPLGNKLKESRFDQSKIDQEFGAAKKALKDAGIKFKALQAIGSLDREKNTFNIPREDMRKARQVLKNFPNTQIKRA